MPAMAIELICLGGVDRKDLPGAEDGTFETLGGFVMMHLSRIPGVTDHSEWGGLRFEVLDMDGRRVDKVLVMPAADAGSV